MKVVATVIGAGIQGCLVALQLAKVGYRVNLLDKMEDIFMGASRNGEGKIHLGMVYALDHTLSTPHKMIEDALLFGPIIEELIGEPVEWDQIQSTPFLYPVHRDSLCSVEDLQERYSQFENLFHELIQDEKSSYLGQSHVNYTRRIKLPEILNRDYFQGCFSTSERAICPECIGSKIKKVLFSTPNINVHRSSPVVGIERKAHGFRTTIRKKDQSINFKSDLVINATWESKKKVDGLMGIQDEHPWHVRFKIGFTGKIDQKLNYPSFTIVQGPFGDFVHYKPMHTCYLSWYPTCKVGSTSSLEIPLEWERFILGNQEGIDIESIKHQTISTFNQLTRGLKFAIDGVKGGTIVAYGRRDIHEISSELHQRNEIPITAHDGYYSVHTSKFTSAPHNVKKLLKIL